MSISFRRWLIAESDELTSWIGGSKVVDDSGKPLPVHHGTASEFTQFRTEPEEFGQLWSGDPGAGMLGPFFTESPEIASSYPKVAPRDARRVISVYLKIENPKRFRTLSQLHRDMIDFAGREGMEARGYFDTALPTARSLAKAYKAWLVSQGHDGVTFMEGPSNRPSSSKARVWVPFSNTQIKHI